MQLRPDFTLDVDTKRFHGRKFFVGLISLLLVAMSPGALRADGEGQADLDDATLLKLRAQSMDDLEKTVRLCESALNKGLDKESETYAKELLTSTLYEHAARMCQAIFERQPPDTRWRAWRRLAIADLEKALQYNDELGQVHLLIARLESLADGDTEKAKKAVGKAIKLLGEDPRQLSTAYFVQGIMSEDVSERETSFEKAIELNPQNIDAWRARAFLNVQREKIDKAIEDFTKILEIDPNDVVSHQAMAEIFGQQKKFDEALAHLDKVIAAGGQSPLTYVLKAQILNEKKEKRAAIDCLTDALKLNARNERILLMLAQLRIEVEDYELALNDLNLVLELTPSETDKASAYFWRSVLAAQQKRYADAIRDIQHLIDADPENPAWRLQLAHYYVGDQRPSKAIAVLTEVVERNPENSAAYRARGDALLNIGRHADAIADYETSLQIEANDSHVLNNLAWVLATSTEDKIRNGKRAIELATKACELTEFKAAHILSTLAAAHAESGDIAEAIKWSQKAVDLDADMKQLTEELKSYQEGKPWREMLKVTEKTDPEPLSDTDLDDEVDPGDDLLEDP
jgi:tetratricopeptide (TPR) repeat protein